MADILHTYVKVEMWLMNKPPAFDKCFHLLLNVLSYLYTHIGVPCQEILVKVHWLKANWKSVLCQVLCLKFKDLEFLPLRNLEHHEH